MEAPAAHEDEDASAAPRLRGLLLPWRPVAVPTGPGARRSRAAAEMMTTMMRLWMAAGYNMDNSLRYGRFRVRFQVNPDPKSGIREPGRGLRYRHRAGHDPLSASEECRTPMEPRIVAQQSVRGRSPEGGKGPVFLPKIWEIGQNSRTRRRA